MYCCILNHIYHHHRLQRRKVWLSTWRKKILNRNSKITFTIFWPPSIQAVIDIALTIWNVTNTYQVKHFLLRRFKCWFYEYINKRPMGHIAHLRKTVQINKHIWIYHNVDKVKKKTIMNLMRVYWFFIWTNLNPLHPRILCAKFGWNWLSGSGEKDCIFVIS